MEEYRGFRYTYYQNENGTWFCEGFSEGGEVKRGVGDTEDYSRFDMQDIIDEYYELIDL